MSLLALVLTVIFILSANRRTERADDAAAGAVSIDDRLDDLVPVEPSSRTAKQGRVAVLDGRTKVVLACSRTSLTLRRHPAAFLIRIRQILHAPIAPARTRLIMTSAGAGGSDLCRIELIRLQPHLSAGELATSS